ncbi:hypothetical protein ARMGADRAFT_1038035 [Armillaria gallica]|uniref:Uncharacterized protein n=1 Tax=Armillaria gallica TaxID=47427 RepID=A0A2H3CJH5_ARMGA|nr:hypothetical protein ARMGADRAFT_1038035 [Armillaria gallica]
MTGATAAPTLPVPATPAGASDMAVPRATAAPAVISAVVQRHPFTCVPLSQPMTMTTATGSSPVAGPSSHPAPPAQVHSDFHCSNCSTFNPSVRQSGESWYVVTAGHEVGVFSNWHTISSIA